MSKIELIIQVGALLVSCVVLVLSIVQLIFQNRQNAKDRLCRDPFLVSGSGSYGEEAKVWFRNDGSSIRNVSMESDGDFQVSLVPPGSIPAGCEGTMTISKYDESRDFYFRMRYETVAGEVLSKRYVFNNRTLQEADNGSVRPGVGRKAAE